MSAIGTGISPMFDSGSDITAPSIPSEALRFDNGSVVRFDGQDETEFITFEE